MHLGFHSWGDFVNLSLDWLGSHAFFLEEGNPSCLLLEMYDCFISLTRGSELIYSDVTSSSGIKEEYLTCLGSLQAETTSDGETVSR